MGLIPAERTSLFAVDPCRSCTLSHSFLGPIYLHVIHKAPIGRPKRASRTALASACTGPYLHAAPQSDFFFESPPRLALEARRGLCYITRVRPRGLNGSAQTWLKPEAKRHR